MANTSSAKKMARKIERRTALNKGRRSRMRTYVKKLQEAVAAGDATAARDALRTAESEVMKAVSKGVIHKNTGSRTVSRLAARVKSMTAPSKSVPHPTKICEHSRLRRECFLVVQVRSRPWRNPLSQNRKCASSPQSRRPDSDTEIRVQFKPAQRQKKVQYANARAAL